MNSWNDDDAKSVAAPQEIEIATARPDGTLRKARTIWIVRDGDRVFVRSTNGRNADWFRGATSTGRATIRAGRTTFDVVLAETDGPKLDAVDAAYRSKYGSYASIVDHLLTEGPRAATLEVTPA